jgi:AcrR family transcriptional regulator
MLDHPQALGADTRTRVLDAAETIVQARGVPALTLDAAAREAGVSKGGLLYHFASKEALVEGLMARLSEFVAAQFEAVFTATTAGPARTARALLAWEFDSNYCHDAQTNRACAVFLVAFHHDPALLDPIRAVFAAIRDRIGQDGLKPGHGSAIMAACDGLFMAHLFRMYTLDPAEKRDLRQALESLL